jgi:hypothetical protein
MTLKWLETFIVHAPQMHLLQNLDIVLSLYDRVNIIYILTETYTRPYAF